MRLSVVCPHCRAPRPGERADVAGHMVTLCYCNTCGVTWTREGHAPAAAKARPRERESPPAPRTGPAPKDLLLRGSFTEGYELVEAVTGVRVAAGLSTLEEVLSVARRHGGQIWQQQVDRSGRAVGKPIRLSLQAQ